MTDFNEYAIIDLGSNSFHMIILRNINSTNQVIYKNKQNIHLATGLNKDNLLSETSIRRGLDCLSLFAERLKNFPKNHVRVIGTYALRTAKNRHIFLTAASKIFPFPIEIISGREEARLIYLGAMTTEPTQPSDTTFVIDIGGGSTEIAIGQGNKFKPYFVISKPMGCVTYTKQFFPNQDINYRSFMNAKLAAEQQLEMLVNYINKQSISLAFGTSGTIKSIHNILLNMGSDGVITKKRLDDLIDYVLALKKFNDLNYHVLSEDRKNLLVSGLAILSSIFDTLNLQSLNYCHGAVREGVLYELIDGDSYRDIRQNTAESLSKQYNVDEKQATLVTTAAKYFFQQWHKQQNIDINKHLEPILYWAAQLHEVGLNINFTSIQKHSSYILKNSNMPGFNEEQQLLLATLVRNCRKSIHLDEFPFFSLFEFDQIMPLLKILRLSILINNQRNANINFNDFKLYIHSSNPDHFTLKINDDFLENNKLILLDLEQEKRYWKNIDNWQLTTEIIKE